MKSFSRFLLLIVSSVLLASSCKANLPHRFESFVNSVEKNAPYYSEDDWTKAGETFEKLYNEYKVNKSYYNPEQKDRINAAIARYAKLVVKSKASGIMESLKGIWGQLPSLMDDTKSYLDEFLLELEGEENFICTNGN